VWSTFKSISIPLSFSVFYLQCRYESLCYGVANTVVWCYILCYIKYIFDYIWALVYICKETSDVAHVDYVRVLLFPSSPIFCTTDYDDEGLNARAKVPVHIVFEVFFQLLYSLTVCAMELYKFKLCIYYIFLL